MRSLIALLCLALLLAACDKQQESRQVPVADYGTTPPSHTAGDESPAWPDPVQPEKPTHEKPPPKKNGHLHPPPAADGHGTGGLGSGDDPGDDSGGTDGIGSGSAEYDADAARGARRDAYLSSLKQAAYTFNTPQSIEFASPPTSVQFWLDPQAEANRLAEELKAELRRLRPGSNPSAEAGAIEWGPRMKATLTGADFDIVPSEGSAFDGIKDVSAQRRTTWSWDVRAKHPGDGMPLHLRVWAQLPKELGEPYEVIKLDRIIRVDVTWWWLLDNFWEKYWKWLLGGIGSALAAAFGWWWKNRKAA